MPNNACKFCGAPQGYHHRDDCPNHPTFKAQKRSPVETMDGLLHENAVLKAALCCVLADNLEGKVSTLIMDRDKYRDVFPNGAKVAIRDDKVLWAVRIEKL